MANTNITYNYCIPFYDWQTLTTNLLIYYCTLYIAQCIIIMYISHIQCTCIYLLSKYVHIHLPTLPSDWSVFGLAVTACTATINSLMVVCKCLSSLMCSSLSTFAASFSDESPRSNPQSLAVGLYLFLYFQFFSDWLLQATSNAESDRRSSITILTASNSRDVFGCFVT